MAGQGPPDAGEEGNLRATARKDERKHGDEKREGETEKKFRCVGSLRKAGRTLHSDPRGLGPTAIALEKRGIKGSSGAYSARENCVRYVKT